MDYEVGHAKKHGLQKRTSKSTIWQMPYALNQTQQGTCWLNESAVLESQTAKCIVRARRFGLPQHCWIELLKVLVVILFYTREACFNCCWTYFNHIALYKKCSTFSWYYRCFIFLSIHSNIRVSSKTCECDCLQLRGSPKSHVSTECSSART